MNEQDFRNALEEFTSKKADELSLGDDLAALGVDSIGIFEFQMKVEPWVGTDMEIHEDVKSVQDLYDCVLAVGEQSA